jgi:hypothetical protein
MATRSYRPSNGAPITDGSQILTGHAHDIAVNQLIPRIDERNKRAVETVPINLYFYQAIRAGRRCSCFDIETSADSLCQACFGTGIVGGYQKYGTTLHVFDVTHPNICSSNVIPDWKSRRKPTPFKLIDGACHGSVETRIHLTSNTGELDALYSDYWLEPGSSLTAYVKAPTDTQWAPLSRDAVRQRLFNPWIEVKVSLDRVSKANPSPLLKTVYLRYKNIHDNAVKANIQRVEKSDLLSEIGVADNWQNQVFWLDSTLKSITTEDFFASIEGDSRWKIYSAKEFAPHGQLVSWDIEAKVIQEHQDGFQKVPI